jgi:hypothetical protein
MRRCLLAFAVALGAEGAELNLGKPGPIPAEEAKELLQAVCPGPIVAEKEDYNKGDLGCATCPGFVIQGWVGAWNLEAVHYGHFTDTKADDAALAMSGCAPHALKFGATVLLTRTDGRWRMKWFQSGLITSRCISVARADGRYLLVCKTEDGGQGMFDRVISLVDPAQRAAKRESELLHLSDNTQSCGAVLDGKPESVKIEKAEFTQVVFAESKLEVSFDFGVGSRAVTEQESQSCQAIAWHSNSFPAGFLPKTKPYTVAFDFDGAKFTVSVSSAGVKRIVESR